MQKPTGSQAITNDWPSSQGPYRRLASIAVLDVVGYSGLMDTDEVGTHARWSEMCARLMIASFVAAGRIEEAREAARTYVGRAPNFSIGSFLERYPLQDSAALAQYGERLLAAGLPP